MGCAGIVLSAVRYERGVSVAAVGTGGRNQRASHEIVEQVLRRFRRVGKQRRPPPVRPRRMRTQRAYVLSALPRFGQPHALYRIYERKGRAVRVPLHSAAFRARGTTIRPRRRRYGCDRPHRRHVGAVAFVLWSG